MSMLALVRRATLSVPADANDVLIQADSARNADCFVDSDGVAWYFGEQRVRLTADLTGSTSTTLADVTGLVFPVKASKQYEFEFELIFQAAGTSGLKVGLTIPSSPTLFTALVRISALKSAPTVSVDNGIINTSGGSLSSTGSLDTGVNARARVRGTLVNGANAGNIQLQWAAATASAGALTPKQGSSGRMWMQ